MQKICENKKCYGCGACCTVCPKDAISLKENETTGHLRPVIDQGKCVDCGLCSKHCPANSEYKYKDNTVTYAAYRTDPEKQNGSSSGGVAAAFYELAIDKNWAIVGTIMDSNFKARMELSCDKQNIEQFKGSKYVQAYPVDALNQVKSVLKEGKNVLFIGTPCECEAARSIAMDNAERLLTVDLICHGVPSYKVFRDYIKWVEVKKKSKIQKISFRSSWGEEMILNDGKKNIWHRRMWWDPYLEAFNSGIINNDACFECPFAREKRCSDLTIGDFWGIKDQNSVDMFKGISVLLINTKKGKQLFDQSKRAFEFKVHALEEVLPGNPALLKNPVRTDKQDKFFDLLKTHPFSYCVSECIKVSVATKIKNKIRGMMGKCKGLVRLILRTDIDVKKFIYYNYFCKNIVRKSNAKVMPHKNAVLDLQGSSKIILSGDKDLNIGINKLKGSRAETHIRLNDTAVWNCNNGADLFYNTVLEIKQGAVFNTGYFSANGGSVIIIHKNINFGDDVMIGRNVITYDSDFHSLYNGKGVACNPPEPVTIEDHVWLTSNVIVQKGVTIGKDSLITAYTTVNRDVPEHSIFGGKSVGKVIKDQVSWGRAICPFEGCTFNED